MTKIYVTKYALSRGVFSVDAEIDGSSAVYRDGVPFYVHGKDFYLTEEAAKSDFERRKKSQLESIEKKRKKIEAAVFKVKNIKG